MKNEYVHTVRRGQPRLSTIRQIEAKLQQDLEIRGNFKRRHKDHLLDETEILKCLTCGVSCKI